MRKLLLAAFLALAAPAAAIPPLPSPPPPAPPPRLLVVISVDQLAADLFDEYRGQFTGGLARIAGGAVFRNGYQAHAASETCPGHSTILTGAHPARTGIVANLWIDQSVPRSDKKIYCAEDPAAPGSSSTDYKVSPRHLLVPTLGERMKARWPASRNVAVAGKDRSAVMMSGRSADQRWYWSGKSFATDLAGQHAAVAARVNSAVATALAQPRPPLEPPPYCQARARAVPVEGGGKPVGTGTLGRAAGDSAALRASPELDGMTLALAAGLVDELQLGRDSQPDLLSVGLAGTDYVGHAFGSGGLEMCLQLFALDRELGDFLRMLDSRGLDYAVALTADHGVQDIPERKRLAGIAAAQRVDPALNSTTMGKALAARLGLSGPGLLGDSSFGDIYVDRALPPRDRARLLAAAVAAYRALPQVEAVYTADRIARTAVPSSSPDRWTLLERLRASYYPGRSGDFVVVLKRHVTPIADTSRYVATHGSPWDHDRRVPILFWRPGMTAATVDAAAATVDIAPTLAAMLKLEAEPGAFDGRCLGNISGLLCPQR